MEVKFEHLSIKDFKSIDEFETDFDKITTIYGANESGKTSVADAISWVLTGKNSLGESTFNIVPVGTVGVSPTVELKLSIGGKGTGYCKKPTIKRVLKAKQARDRSFTGEYQTECYINGVKYTQRDFDSWIGNEICTPEVFRLIHDVRYFTENISVNGKERPWEARRRLLMQLCGLESDYKIALSDERFKGLAERLIEFTDANQYLTFNKKALSTTLGELNHINSEIELYHKMEDSGESEQESTQSMTKSNIEKRLADLRQQYNLEKVDYHRATQDYEQKRKDCNDNLILFDTEVKRDKANLEMAQKQLAIEKQNYEKYGIACPTCGRRFARGFAEQKKAEYDEAVATLDRKIAKIRENLNASEGLYKQCKKEYDELQKNQPVQPDLSGFEDEIKCLSYRIAEIEAKEKQKAELDAQIKDAESRRKELSATLSELNRDIDLCREFISYKCKSIENKVNSLFDGIEFVMFRENKTNDEIRECCDIKWHGVDYNDLSYSTKFVVSLIIVQGFQKCYGLSFPVTLDNAESVDMDTNMVNQLVLLTKRSVPCPECGWSPGRKQKDGFWHCKKCGHKFKIPLTVELYAGD